MAETLNIGRPAIEVRLRRNARARRMILRVARSGAAPVLTLPPGVPVAAARRFLDDKEAWLRKHLDAGPERVTVGIGSQLPLGGELIEIVRGSGRRPLRSGGSLAVAGPPARAGRQVMGYLKIAAREACVAAVAVHCARLDLRPGRVSLRDPRSRWGSCTTRGDLMFSWRLIMAPGAVLDYVAAHEVAHLVEMNHSPRFWALVRELCTGSAEPREWLRRNGAGLHAYDFAAVQEEGVVQREKLVNAVS